MKLISKNYFLYLFKDYFFKYFSGITGFFFFAISSLLFLLSQNRTATSLLLKSIRLNASSSAIAFLKANVKLLKLNELVTPNIPIESAISRSIILSLPTKDGNNITKGVLLITFTETFSYYVTSPIFQELNKLFVFVLEPSSSGYSDADILSFVEKAEHCIIQTTEVTDAFFLNAIYPIGIAASFGASNWVNPSVFAPLDIEKVYDSIYVANLNPIKRIYRYVDAVANILTVIPNYKACMVCVNYGGSFPSIISYIDQKKMGDSFTLIPGLKRHDLVHEINKSKVSILLSRKEGSNRSLFESMFVNLPSICISENKGVNKSYINEFTGLLIPDRFLEDALISMHSNWKSYSPREWALNNIAPQITTKRLASLIDQKFPCVCNTKLLVKTNDPELTYIDSNLDYKKINRVVFNCLMPDSTDKLWDTIASLRTSFN